MDDDGVFFEDLEEGERAPVRSHRLTRTDLVRYAGASHDFNPLHHDEERARAAGQRGVFAHGMLAAGLLAGALTDLVGVGNLRGYRVRFTNQAWPDDVLTTQIVVRSKDAATRLVELDCEVVTGTGTVVLAGSAVAAPRWRG